MARLLTSLFTSGAPATSIADSRRAAAAGGGSARSPYARMAEPGGGDDSPKKPVSLIRSLTSSAIDATVRVTSAATCDLSWARQVPTY